MDDEKKTLTKEEREQFISNMKEKYHYDEMSDEQKAKFDSTMDKVCPPDNTDNTDDDDSPEEPDGIDRTPEPKKNREDDDDERFF